MIHTIAGAMGYRLECNGLSPAYTADSEPSTFEAEQAMGADVFIHEIMPSAEEFAEKNHMPLQHGQNVMYNHTTPAELGPPSEALSTRPTACCGWSGRRCTTKRAYFGLRIVEQANEPCR